MFSIYGNAFDVIKTNRIVHSDLAKTAGENLTNELALLWERGAFRNGLFRGLAPVIAFNLWSNTFGKFIPMPKQDGSSFSIASSLLWLGNPVVATVFNPLLNLQTLRQVVHAEHIPTYMELLKSVNPVRLVTLGLPALIARNAILSLAYMPRLIGNTEVGVDALAITAVVALSHPLEVSRVLIINGAKDSSAMFGNSVATLQSIYASEGVAGMYRGFVPRAIYLFPTMLTFAEVLFPGETFLARLRKPESPQVTLADELQPIA
jgi:hypothetical protein